MDSVTNNVTANAAKESLENNNASSSYDESRPLVTLQEPELDSLHIEKVSHFVRKHRQDSISFTRKRSSIASFTSFLGEADLKQLASEKRSRSPSVTPSLQMHENIVSEGCESPAVIQNTKDLDYPSTYTPIEFAHLIYTKQLELDNVTEILGKRDVYYSQVLVEFMDCFDFSDIQIDAAFRLVGTKIDIIGETQVVDRILFQIARRFWDCNEKQRDLLKSIDITYALLFSLVLLNTDLHIANVGSKDGNKMNLKEFLKNTLELIEIMASNDPLVQKEWKEKDDRRRKWRKQMESLLKEFYQSIKTLSLIQKPYLFSYNQEPSPLLPLDDVSDARFVRRSNSTWSMSSSATTGSIFSRSSTTSSTRKIGMLDRFFTRRNRNDSIKLLCKSLDGLLQVDESDMFHGKQILFQGVCIRKHLLEEKNQKAKNRRWTKYWCVLLESTESAILVMHRMESQKSPASHKFDFAQLSTCLDESFSTQGEIKMSLKNQESFLMVHSYAQILRPMSYNIKRPFIFSVCLANGSTYLFQVQSLHLAEEWTNHCNCLAARKSKEPLRDTLSSVDYGWNQIEWAQKKAQLDKKEMDIHSLVIYTEKVRLGEWEAPFTSKILSILDRNQQLENIEKQLLIIQKEVDSHQSYKSWIEILFKDTGTRSKALSNWLKKQNYLESELKKYQLYAAALKPQEVGAWGLGSGSLLQDVKEDEN